ncbi:MAG TPA: UDP-N-acetylmuramoyl-tripeptide--D-alanyl-D-alanine ligase, partial [Vicinamibacteria bacterium]|nr:UDP-N-acetylmuramoyl-tripeptide--D-alanyl-D-alanine ligase [Vicinamibacteria bacterium]
DLFFAIAGPRHDGHDFLREVVEKGAAGVVIHKRSEVPKPAFAIHVEDTSRALQDLAGGFRRSRDVKVVAITGSMGKTTTKEAAATAIGSTRTVLKSEGNLNNFYGLPLSLLRLEDEEIAVLEMGMSAPGEIARLTEIARPDVGVLTNVAEVHLEFFRSLSAIADAKGELFRGLSEGATAVVNADDPLVREQARGFSGRKLRFGVEKEADVRASAIRATPSGLRFSAIFRGEEREIATSLRGRHNVYNLLAGLAAASALDVPFEEAARALSAIRPATHRGERLDFGRGFLLLDETYNSNPRALRAALASLSEERGRRRIAVLGDMRELGETGATLHREVGRYAATLPIDRLIGVGPLAAELIAGARGAGAAESSLGHVDDAEEAGKLLLEELREGDVVLLKASRGIGLERAIEAIRRGVEGK